MTAAGFASSFEAADPVPTWTDTVDTDARGNPRASGAAMRTRPGNGPSSVYTARPDAGFTGLHALGYAGSHTATGPAHVTNKIFWVEVPVAPDTELSYVLFPELLDDDLRYPSTFVAVDLAFTDGTLLSELGATDHLGFPLTARGQGESDALYPQQWNRRACRIGDVADGKTITRVLLSYDCPHGPARFAGWVDDLAIRAAPPPRRRRPTDYVITTRGTNSTGTFSRGNTFPATAVPHGFNFWTPVTNAGATNWFYEYHRGNNARNLPELQAFGLSHQPSPWIGDRHTFHVMPQATAGRPNPRRTARALSFRHDNEIARAHYYGVRFDNGIGVEITPTDHAAMLRFTFPGPEATLLFDNVGAHDGGLTIDVAGGTVTGYTDVRSGLSVGAGRMFVHATFDRPVAQGGKLRRCLRRRVTGFVRFVPDPDAPTTVTMRIATSLISPEQARRNLELEIAADDTFDTVAERAREQWDELLGRVEVEGATEDQLVTLYSNLYRLFLYPNRGHERTDSGEAYASPFRAGVRPGRIFVNNGFWDTYRTCWPAYVLLTPTRCGELIDGFVQHYRDGGWISRWSAPGYANLMTGTSSDVAFADAYLKGVTNFDVASAYLAAVRNATVTPPHDAVGRRGLDRSIFRRYTETSVPEGLSWTLEGCVNDFGIANLAGALGDADNHAYFLDRARNYTHSFDPAIGFFQGHTADGGWRSPPEGYDARVWGHDYTETNGWNTAFAVPHDGQGLANLHGGRDGLAAKLDALFATPETARFPGSYGRVIHEMTEARDLRMGQYAHSNQPSHHIIYLYCCAGRPWQAQRRVREVLSRAYAGSEIGQGYCGDEDNGEMSAWWLFSALGFYPLRVGSPEYVIGSPLFTRATVHLENGRDLVVNAPNNGPRNIYVQSLRVNGEPYEKTWLPHGVLASGAVLDFEMGPRPSAWGGGPDAVPPSITTGDAPPATLQDVTTPGYGRAVTSDGRNPAGVVDDTTRTEHRFSGPRPWVRWTLPQPREVVSYTLTSARWAGDPRSWTLEGSADGAAWTALDERTGQDFRWRRQTRAFTVTSPGRYTHYRLTITSGTEIPARLAQIELLAR